ncbi:MAG: hypothetical protein LH472_09775 [Pyrinomonadaceae bacterium]|nr:hypothetical protein [Pyrinomonadaceae bacterium]
MKLRVRGNSIRLRLLRGEVAEFAANGTLRETVNFGAANLTYILQVADDGGDLSAKFADNQIVVSVPTAMAREWTETESVGLAGEQKFADGEFLKILVEKDFVCLDRIADEDNQDAYPNTSHKC